MIMGTPLPPNKPALPCATCWGVGKEFGDSPTPHVLELRLTSFLPGEFWTAAFDAFLLTTHLLEKTAGSCNWQIDSAGFRFIIDYLGPFTNVLITHLPTAHGVFQNTLAPLCSADVENLIVVPAGNIIHNGFANITWDPAGL